MLCNLQFCPCNYTFLWQARKPSLLAWCKIVDRRVIFQLILNPRWSVLKQVGSKAMREHAPKLLVCVGQCRPGIAGPWWPGSRNEGWCSSPISPWIVSKPVSSHECRQKAMWNQLIPCPHIASWYSIPLVPKAMKNLKIFPKPKKPPDWLQ